MKKKISLLLAFVVLISAFASFGVQAAVTSFTDVTAETKYQSAIITLTKMGLIQGYEENGAYSFKPDNQITRAEFTAIITRALGAGNIDSGTSSFPDAQDHWARGNIQVACDKGIVKGFEDGTFRPDDNVTYEQAVKMVVCTLGYEAPSLLLGGWPNGYLSQASKLGVTDSISGVVNTEPTSRGVVAQLIYNALEIDVLEVSVESEESRDAQTFMEKYLNMKKEKGIIVGVHDQVTAQCPSALGLNQMAAIVNGDIVYLDFREFTTNKADLTKYLGQTVEIFYQEVVGSDFVLIDVASETTKNTVTEIASSDLISYDNGDVNYYDKNEKKKSFKVDSENLSVIYNNVLVPADDVNSKLTKWFDENGTELIYGTVKLTDSGSDDSINLIDITDYEIYIAAKAPTTTDYKITNKLKGTGIPDGIILNPDGDIDFTITLDGKEIQTTAIRTNDVVLVATSDDGDKATVVVTREKVSGKITAYYEEDEIIVVNGKEYEFHDKFFEYNSKDAESFKKVGAEVELYMDYYGKVVYGTVTAAQSSSPYAYIINAGEHDDGEGYFINMFIPASNTTKVYTLRDKVTVDGTSMDASEAISKIKEHSNATASSGKSLHYQDEDENAWGTGETVTHSPAAQVARVTVSNNLITSITRVKEEIGTQVTDISGLSKYSDLAKLTYKGSNNFDKFYINSSTTVIFVAQDRTDGQDYSKKTSSAFSKDKSYYVEAFNVNSSKIADLVLVYGSQNSGTSVDDNSLIDVVADKGTTVDNDGTPTLKLPYYHSAATITEKLVGTSEYKDLVPGDLFQTGTNKYGNLSGLKLRIKYDDIKEMLENSANAIEEENTESMIFNWIDSDSGYSDGNVGKGSKFHYITNTSATSLTGKRGALHMYNVIEADAETKAIRVTRDGFTYQDGEWVLGKKPEDLEDGEDAFKELRFTYSSEPVVLRYDADDKEISPYVKDTETKLTVADLTGSDVLGTGCSKIALFEYYGAVKMIVIYE